MILIHNQHFRHWLLLLSHHPWKEFLTQLFYQFVSLFIYSAAMCSPSWWVWVPSQQSKTMTIRLIFINRSPTLFLGFCGSRDKMSNTKLSFSSIKNYMKHCTSSKVAHFHHRHLIIRRQYVFKKLFLFSLWLRFIQNPFLSSSLA